MYHYFINREWMISSAARRVYRSAAKLSLAFFFLVWFFPLLDRVPPTFYLLLRLFVFAGVLSAALLIVAMEYFLFGFDRSSETRRALSFLLMMLPILGSAIYCLTTYSRLTAPADNSDEARFGASA